MWSCMPGGLREVVLSFKFRQNRLNGFQDLGGRNLPFPILKASGLYNSLYYLTSRDFGTLLNWILQCLLDLDPQADAVLAFFLILFSFIILLFYVTLCCLNLLQHLVQQPVTKHWILFPTVWHLPRLFQERTQGRPKCPTTYRRDSLDVAK